jgi:hypothetical protein
VLLVCLVHDDDSAILHERCKHEFEVNPLILQIPRMKYIYTLDLRLFEFLLLLLFKISEPFILNY